MSNRNTEKRANEATNEQKEIKGKRSVIKVRWEKQSLLDDHETLGRSHERYNRGREDTVRRKTRPNNDDNEQLGAHLQKTTTGHVQVVQDDTTGSKGRRNHCNDSQMRRIMVMWKVRQGRKRKDEKA